MTNPVLSSNTMLLELLEAQQRYRSSRGVVHRTDGQTVDVRIGSSATLLRGVEVAGDATSIVAGDRVLIQWESINNSTGRVPVAFPLSGGRTSPSTAVSSTGTVDLSGAVDGRTIKVNNIGKIGVAIRGIGLEHLDHVPSLVGHTHKDSLTRNGWEITPNGAIFTANTYIHSDGVITLGTDNDILTLDSTDALYRLWVGHATAASAPFSVTQGGAMHAALGDIAGWDIVSDSLSKNDIELLAAGRI